jgi:hypothetical protein
VIVERTRDFIKNHSGTPGALNRHIRINIKTLLLSSVKEYTAIF